MVLKLQSHVTNPALWIKLIFRAAGCLCLYANNRKLLVCLKNLLTWLAAIGELFFTHSSTILTTARRIFGSGDFSISEVRMTWMKFFLISMLITDNRVFTRSRLSIINSLVTENRYRVSAVCTKLNNNDIKQHHFFSINFHIGFFFKIFKWTIKVNTNNNCWGYFAVSYQELIDPLKAKWPIKQFLCRADSN